MKTRGFEVVKGYEDKDIHLPVRGTKHAAGYDIEATEDITIPVFEKGIKPTLVPTGLKAYCKKTSRRYSKLLCRPNKSI